MSPQLVIWGRGLSTPGLWVLRGMAVYMASGYVVRAFYHAGSVLDLLFGFVAFALCIGALYQLRPGLGRGRMHFSPEGFAVRTFLARSRAPWSYANAVRLQPAGRKHRQTLVRIEADSKIYDLTVGPREGDIDALAERLRTLFARASPAENGVVGRRPRVMVERSTATAELRRTRPADPARPRPPETPPASGTPPQSPHP